MITFLLLGSVRREEDASSCAANMNRRKAAYTCIPKHAERELNDRDWLAHNRKKASNPPRTCMIGLRDIGNDHFSSGISPRSF